MTDEAHQPLGGADYVPAVKAAMDNLLVGRPFVKAGKAFGYYAYKVNGKVFAWVAGNGIAIKLPKDQVAALSEANAGTMGPLEVQAGTVWREWVSIRVRTGEDVQRYAELVESALEYVQGLR